MKKFLSLVMALVLTMSLVTISAGAKDFTDNSKITYTKAVDVISAAKIVDGYSDGSFNPAGTLTRGAAAKIICNMILGPTTAAALGVNAKPFSDVAVDNVFAGYISYCSQQGIINGYADGTFRPAGLVTGNQFMKMLLGALGYDGSIEGFTGPNWTVNVIKLAKNLSLDDGNDNFVGSKAMTREEACLYAFNTMLATMVEYSDNSTITVGNITISNKSKASSVKNTTKTDGNIDKDGLMQFAEKYFDKLKGAPATDDFGRPATKYTYDGSTVGTYADSADKTMVVAKARTAEQVLISDSDYFDYNTGDVNSDVVVYLNGARQSTTKAGLAGVSLLAGDQVEVFEDSNDNAATVAVVRYSLAKIDEVNTSLSSTYTKKGATASITLKSLNDAGIGGTYYDTYDGDSTKELPGFSASTYKADAVLAVALNGNTILDSYLATVNTGKVTAYNSGDKANVTVGGTAYPLHATIDTKSNVGVANNSLSFNYNDSTYTAYTDKNGYVIGIDVSASVKIEDVYYVTGIAKDTGMYSDSYYAQAVALKDGSVTSFKLKTDDLATVTAFYPSATVATFANTFSAATPKRNNVDTAVAGLYTFDKDGSKYTAKVYDDASDSTYYVYATGGTDVKMGAPYAVATDLAKDDTKMTVNGQKVYLNSSTNYVKVEDVGDDISVKTVTGGTAVKAAFSAIAVCTKVSGNYVASYVILVSNDFQTATSDNVVFVHDSSNSVVSYTDANGKTKTGYSVELYFLDGSGKIETETVARSSAPAVGFYTWEINDDKVYELTNDVASLYDQFKADGKYDDETGFIPVDGSGALNTAGVVLSNIYNNALTIANSATTGYSKNKTGAAGDVTISDLGDVSFATNVIVRDDRDQSDRDNDAYTTEITSVSQLKSAIDKANSDVNAIVYYDNGKVVMVYVKSMTDTTPAATKYTVTFNALATGLTLSVNGTTYTGSGANVTINLVNGAYAYTISGAGYQTYTGSVTVNGANVSATMPTYYTFTNTNAAASVNGVTLSTDVATGTHVLAGSTVTLTVGGTQPASSQYQLTANGNVVYTFNNTSGTGIALNYTTTITVTANTTVAIVPAP